jgi:hypothetical protein
MPVVKSPRASRENGLLVGQELADPVSHREPRRSDFAGALLLILNQLASINWFERPRANQFLPAGDSLVLLASCAFNQDRIPTGSSHRPGNQETRREAGYSANLRGKHL